MSACMVGTKSSATVQQRQPLASSTIFSSGQLSMPQPRKVSPSMPTLPNSLTMMASRLPLAFSKRWRTSVVLPAPRKPVMMVAGMRCGGRHSAASLACSKGAGKRAITLVCMEAGRPEGSTTPVFALA